MKRALCSLLSGFVVAFIFWLYGFDFSERNPDLAVALIWSIMVSGLVYFLIWWDDL